MEYLTDTDGLVNCSEGSECISDDDDGDQGDDSHYPDGCPIVTGLRACDRILAKRIADGRLYTEGIGQHEEMWEYYWLLHIYHTNPNKASRGDPPNVPQHVFDELIALGLIDENVTRKAESIRASIDPRNIDMALFVSSTDKKVCIQAFIGPCVSYYIYSLVESILFHCTTEDERTSIDYTGCIDDLVNLYQVIAFSVHTDSQDTWLTNDDNLLIKYRKTMARSIPKSKNNIPADKILSFIQFLVRANELGLLSTFLPDSIIEKMLELEDFTSGDNQTQYETIVDRANYTQTMIDALGECRKWVGRKLYRAHYVLAMVALKLWELHKLPEVEIDLSEPANWEPALNAMLNKETIVAEIIDAILGTKSPGPSSSSTSSNDNQSERRFRNRVLHVKVRDMARTQIDSLINGARRTSTSSTKKK